MQDLKISNNTTEIIEEIMGKDFLKTAQFNDLKKNIIDSIKDIRMGTPSTHCDPNSPGCCV